MKPQKKLLNLQQLRGKGDELLRWVSRYFILCFVLLLLVTYGFLLLQIHNLASAQPSDSDIQAQLKTSAAPHIDPSVVQQMQALQDNSVSVQTLFNQARNNPFQE